MKIKDSDGKLYIFVMFDCVDSSVIDLAMDTNMKSPLCVQIWENSVKVYPDLRGVLLYSDRESQYTRQIYREAILGRLDSEKSI